MASGIASSGQAWQHPCVHHRWIRKQITGSGFEESARNYKDHPGVSMKKCQTLIGGTNAWLRDRGVQEPGAEMVRDMENFSA
jgi:hypothetical protein